MKNIERLKNHLFPKGFKREVYKRADQVLKRITGKQLSNDFERIGLSTGDTICVHSSMRSIGHIEGGGPLPLSKAC